MHVVSVSTKKLFPNKNADPNLTKPVFWSSFRLFFSVLAVEVMSCLQLRQFIHTFVHFRHIFLKNFVFLVNFFLICQQENRWPLCMNPKVASHINNERAIIAAKQINSSKKKRRRKWEREKRRRFLKNPCQHLTKNKTSISILTAKHFHLLLVNPQRQIILIVIMLMLTMSMCPHASYCC